MWAVLGALGGGEGRAFSVDIITLSLQLSLPRPASGRRAPLGSFVISDKHLGASTFKI